MAFRYLGLAPEPFAPLLALDDARLAARNMRRLVADEKPGFPCRVSLEDAEPGEPVLLVPFEHQTAASPYRASGPIFIRENAACRFDRVGPPPGLMRNRLLSLRAYDEAGMMVEADVAENDELETRLADFFGRCDVAYVHIHFAKRGCYLARVERASQVRHPPR